MIRTFAELMFLALFASSATPEVHPGSGRSSLVRVARQVIPDGAGFGLLNRATLLERILLASDPVNETRREYASRGLDEFAGGPAGTLLIGAALLAAVAFMLAVVIPW